LGVSFFPHARRGHPDCKITCDDDQGCIAYYDESGECGDDCCKTTCTDNHQATSKKGASLRKGAVAAQGVSENLLTQLMRKVRERNKRP
jgi:hypothetical protein